MELVRYIHLNPLRRRQVTTLKQLDRYRYSGHSALMGHQANEWLAVDAVLRFLGKSVSKARQQYRRFVEQGIEFGKRPKLTGGRLIRSPGGWGAVKAMRRLKDHVKGDERILGDSDFVQAVLSEQNEKLEARYHLRAQGVDFRYALNRVARISGLEAEQILHSGKQPEYVWARSLLCYGSTRELGMAAVAVSELIGISQSAVTRAAYRGKAIAADNNFKLVETIKA